MVKIRQDGQVKFNDFLARCFKSGDVNSLVSVLYGTQVSMDKLVKKKVAKDDDHLFFIRVQRAIEKTLKALYRKKYPNPLDNPKNKEKYISHLGEKRARDAQFEKLIRKLSF